MESKLLRLKLKATIYRLDAKETIMEKNKQTQKAEAMNRSDLSKLVREAAIKNRWKSIDIEHENSQKSAVYFPEHAKLGDDDLFMLKFVVEESAFTGMMVEEIQTFIAEQFPEHMWGYISCWTSEGLYHVSMQEAKFYADCTKKVKIDELAKLARESAVITVYGDIDVPDYDQQFILEVNLDKNIVLELMDESEFTDLVISQFPEYDWWDERSHEENGLISVSLLSDGMMDKFFDDLIAEGMSTVKTSSMKEMHVDLVGYQRLAALVKKSSSPKLSENGPYIRVRMPKVILELFRMEELADFILGQFPEHKAGPSGPQIIGEKFALDLVPIAPADSAS